MDDDADYRRAISYLKSAQRAACLKRGMDPRPFTSGFAEGLKDFFSAAFDMYGNTATQSFEDFVAEIRKAISDESERSASEYEHVGSYFILQQLIRDLRTSIDEFKLELCKEPIFGTLPSGNINGVALSFSNSRYWLIVFEVGLFGFANLFCKAVANAFPSVGDKQDEKLTFSIEPHMVVEEIENNPDLIKKFADVLFSYVIEGDPHQAEPYLPKKDRIPLIHLLCRGMELFVVGHEYGHCLAGHLERINEVELSSAPDRPNSEVWEKEYEADIIGAMLTIKTLQRDRFDLALSIAGIEMWFICVHVVEQAVGILSGGSSNASKSVSHPPALDRRDTIRMILREQFDSDFEDACRLGENLSNVVEIMWSKLIPLAQQLYRDGHRPHQIWS